MAGCFEIALTAEGFPVAASVEGGLGVPVTMVPGADFFVDGEKIERVVAYSIPNGWLLAHALDAQGRVYRDHETDKVAVRRLQGVIEVRAAVAA